MNSENHKDGDNHSKPWSLASLFAHKARILRLCSIVLGIELCYAAETVFVSPILARIGVNKALLSSAWSLSPLVGLFGLPILGACSDRCSSRFGKRRPFILLLSVGILLGVVAVPNVPALYYSNHPCKKTHNLTSSEYSAPRCPSAPIVIVLCTIIGICILDVCCDACQSPARSYLLDVTTTSEEKELGLTAFTVLSGIGGTAGYILGGFRWYEQSSQLNNSEFGHEQLIFASVGAVYLICLLICVTSYDEAQSNTECGTYETLTDSSTISGDTNEISGGGSLVRDYFQCMPNSLKRLCFINLFSWMALLCYSLFFTHFVGEVVYRGDPHAMRGTVLREMYETGFHMGAFAMSLYAFSCCVYSYFLKSMIDKFGSISKECKIHSRESEIKFRKRAKRMYLLGLLSGSAGMFLTAVFKSVWVCFLCSILVGFLYASLFTMPYIMLSRYNTNHFQLVDEDERNQWKNRSLNMDLTVVSSMVFLGQILVAGTSGVMVYLSGTDTATIYLSSLFSLIAAGGAMCLEYIEY